MTETRSLHRKLAQVMLEAERIPKRGRAPQVMGGYPFVQVGDAADYIRKALAEQLLTMVPTSVRVVGMQDRITKQGGNMTTVDLIVTWTITDGESGESITIESFGAGADGGDKYSGKASTSAMKYALLTGFLLSTGEDSELGTAEAGDHALKQPVLAKGETRPTGDGGLIGTVATKAEWLQDLALRQTPDGYVLGFLLKQGRQSQKVQAHGAIAEQVAALASIEGVTVTAWGTLKGEEFTPKGTTRPVAYQVLHLERLHGPTFDIETGPSLDRRMATDATPEPEPAPDGVVGLTEAESEALWAEIDGIGA